MAIVSKQEIVLPNGSKFIRVIKYNPKKKWGDPPANFSIYLPEFVSVLIEKEKVTAPSQDIAEALFKEALQEYQNAAKKVEKKIIIKLEVEIEAEKQKFQRGQDYELAFNWGVYEKTTVGAKYTYKFIEIGHPVLDPYYHNSIEERKNSLEIKIVPWTKERQLWCENLESGILKMFSNILNFMNENDNLSFAKRLDQGNTKLLN